MTYSCPDVNTAVGVLQFGHSVAAVDDLFLMYKKD